MFGSAEAMVAVLEIAFSYQPPRCPFLGLGSFGKKEAISPQCPKMGLGSFRISVRARCRAVPFGRRRHTTQFQATTDKPGLLVQLIDVIREIDCDWTPNGEPASRRLLAKQRCGART